MDGVMCNSKDELYNEMTKAIREVMANNLDDAEYYEELLRLPKDVLLEMFKDTYEEV